MLTVREVNETDNVLSSACPTGFVKKLADLYTPG